MRPCKCLFRQVAWLIKTILGRKTLDGFNGAEKHQRTLYKSDKFLRDQTENQRAPPGDPMSRNDYHVNILTFDCRQDLPTTSLPISALELLSPPKKE